MTERSHPALAAILLHIWERDSIHASSNLCLQGGENGEAPPEQGGFMGGIMGKANALKAKAAETAAAAGAGNLQVSVEIFLKRSEGQPRVVSVLGSPSWIELLESSSENKI